jgi:hypothetical protein
MIEDSTDHMAAVERTLDYLGLDENPPPDSIFSGEAGSFLTTESTQFPLSDIQQPLSGRGTHQETPTHSSHPPPNLTPSRNNMHQTDMTPPRTNPESIVRIPTQISFPKSGSQPMSLQSDSPVTSPLGDNRPRSLSFSTSYTQFGADNLSIKIPTGQQTSFGRMPSSIHEHESSSAHRSPSLEDRWDEMVLYSNPELLRPNNGPF